MNTVPFYDMSQVKSLFMFQAKQSVEGMNPKQLDLYKSLIREEVEEFYQAVAHEPRENQLKELCDIMEVVMGAIFSMGVNANDAMKLVQSNNLLKVQRTPNKRVSGKIMKSPESIAAKAVMMAELSKLVATGELS